MQKVGTHTKTLSPVVTAWGSCSHVAPPAKKRSSKRRGVIHSFLNINEFCKRIMEILVFV